MIVTPPDVDVWIIVFGGCNVIWSNMVIWFPGGIWLVDSWCEAGADVENIILGLGMSAGLMMGSESRDLLRESFLWIVFGIPKLAKVAAAVDVGISTFFEGDFFW